jgi:hypothetical protein
MISTSGRIETCTTDPFEHSTVRSIRIEHRKHESAFSLTTSVNHTCLDVCLAEIDRRTMGNASRCRFHLFMWWRNCVLQGCRHIILHRSVPRKKRPETQKKRYERTCARVAHESKDDCKLQALHVRGSKCKSYTLLWSRLSQISPRLVWGQAWRKYALPLPHSHQHTLGGLNALKPTVCMVSTFQAMITSGESGGDRSHRMRQRRRVFLPVSTVVSHTAGHGDDGAPSEPWNRLQPEQTTEHQAAPWPLCPRLRAVLFPCACLCC